MARIEHDHERALLLRPQRGGEGDQAGGGESERPHARQCTRRVTIPKTYSDSPRKVSRIFLAVSGLNTVSSQ